MSTISARTAAGWGFPFLFAWIIAALQLAYVSMLPHAVGAQVQSTALWLADEVSYLYFAAGVCGMIVIGHVLDMRYWKQKAARRVKHVWYALTSAVALVGVFTASKVFSAAILLTVLVVHAIISGVVSYSICHVLRCTGPEIPRSFGRTQVFCGIITLFAFVYFITSTGTEEENCGTSTYWSNVLMREWAYFEVGCPLEIEITPNTGVATSYECTWRSACSISNHTYDQENVPSGTYTNDDGFCISRAHDLLVDIANDLLRDEGLIASNESALIISPYSDTASAIAEAPSDINRHYLLNFTNGADLSICLHHNMSVFARVRSRYHGCTNAFLLWMGPFVLGLFALWIGAGTMVVIVSDKNDAKNYNRSDLSRKILSRATIVCLLFMWIGASIGGADMDLAKFVMTVSASALILLFVGYITIHGSGDIREALRGSKFAKRIAPMIVSDWGLGLMFLCLSPCFIVYIFMSIPCQFMRRVNPFGCNCSLEPEFKNHILTKGVQMNLARAREVNWTSVLSKLIILGLLFMSLNVFVSKFTSVGLSALNDWIREQNFSMTQITLVFFGVGMFGFLNPMIPGPPIYVSGGILLVEGTRDLFASMVNDNSEIGYWIAIAYTIGVCMLLKMVAITVQQKLFGEVMGRYISIRRFIGVNTVGCRAIKLILQDKGLTLRKVFILCGGPDWPTSVTTGILGLPLLSMLIGSLPIVLLIAPSVLAGAFLLRTSESSIWSSVSLLAVGFSVIVQSGSMLGAMHVISKVAIEREAQLADMPPDQEVLDYTEKTEHRNAILAHVKNWNRMGFPLSLRIILIIGAFCMIISFDLAVGMGSYCFQSFSVSDSIEEELGGDPLALIIWPMGHICLLLFAISIVCLLSANCAFNCLVSRAIKVAPLAASEPNQSAPKPNRKASLMEDLQHLQEVSKNDFEEEIS